MFVQMLYGKILFVTNGVNKHKIVGKYLKNSTVINISKLDEVAFKKINICVQHSSFLYVCVTKMFAI